MQSWKLIFLLLTHQQNSTKSVKKTQNRWKPFGKKHGIIAVEEISMCEAENWSFHEWPMNKKLTNMVQIQVWGSEYKIHKNIIALQHENKSMCVNENLYFH